MKIGDFIDSLPKDYRGLAIDALINNYGVSGAYSRFNHTLYRQADFFSYISYDSGPGPDFWYDMKAAFIRNGKLTLPPIPKLGEAYVPKIPPVTKIDKPIPEAALSLMSADQEIIDCLEDFCSDLPWNTIGGMLRDRLSYSLYKVALWELAFQQRGKDGGNEIRFLIKKEESLPCVISSFLVWHMSRLGDLFWEDVHSVASQPVVIEYDEVDWSPTNDFIFESLSNASHFDYWDLHERYRVIDTEYGQVCWTDIAYVVPLIGIQHPIVLSRHFLKRIAFPLKISHRDWEIEFPNLRAYIWFHTLSTSSEQKGKFSWADPWRLSTAFLNSKPKLSLVGGAPIRSMHCRKRGSWSKVNEVINRLGIVITKNFGPIENPAVIQQKFNRLLDLGGDITAHIVDDIPDFYKKFNLGTAGTSCMRENPGGCLSFYTLNDDKVKLIRFEQDGENVARGLAWLVEEDEWYLDRLYGGEAINVLSNKFRSLLGKDKSFELCGMKFTDARNGNQTEFSGTVMGNTLSVLCLRSNGERIPYLDSFQYLNLCDLDSIDISTDSEGNCISTSMGGDGIFLTEEEDESNEVWSDIQSAYISSEDAVEVHAENGRSQGVVHINEARYSETHNCYIYEDDAVYDGYNETYCYQTMDFIHNGNTYRIDASTRGLILLDMPGHHYDCYWCKPTELLPVIDTFGNTEEMPASVIVDSEDWEWDRDQKAFVSVHYQPEIQNEHS